MQRRSAAMTTLEWQDAHGTYVCDGYRIEPESRHRWLLTLDDPRIRMIVGRRFQAGRTFGSLRSARAAALHLEVVKVRRIKLIRHVTVSIVMIGLSVAFYLTMSAGTETSRLEWFGLAGAALVLALREGVDAFALAVADGWDHRYEVPRISMVDRIVSSAVVAALWRKGDVPSLEEPAVRVIPLT